MKKKAATIFTIAMLAFVPSTARADIEVSGFMELVNVAMEKVDKAVKQYTNIQAKLQELSLNRNIVSQLKDKVTSEIKSQAAQAYGEVKDFAMAQGAMLVKTSLSSISLPGIGQYVNLGAYVNPKLNVAVGQTYLKQQHKKDDIRYISTMDKKNNDLMVENLATVFANALVRRVQLIEEDPCRCVDANDNLVSDVPNCGQDQVSACKEKRGDLGEMSDVNVVKAQYFNTVRSAHYRWLRLLEAEATYSKMIAENLMNKGNVDDIEEIIGVKDESLEEKEEEDDAEKIKEQIEKLKEQNTLALTKFTTNALADIRDGNITKAFADVAGGASSVYGNAPGHWDSVATILDNTATGAKTIDGIYNNTERGNWGGALNSALGGAGTIVGNNGDTGMGALIGNASRGSGAALNAALNGNWGDVVRHTSGVAGGAVSGSGDGTLGSTIGAVGSLTDAGIDAVNAGGDWSDYIDNTIGNRQVRGALGSVEGAYKNQNEQDEEWLDAVRKAEEQQSEQLQNDLDELNKQVKQERCKKCIEENEERTKAGLPKKSTCVVECS